MSNRGEDLRDAAFELLKFARIYWVDSRGYDETSGPVVDLHRLAAALRQVADEGEAFTRYELDNDL